MDFRETGPSDLLEEVRRWADDNSTVLIPSVAAVAIAGLLAVGVFDMEIPEIPTWLRVFLVGAIAAGLIAYIPAKTLVEWLYSPDTVVLVEVDPGSGDLSVHEISPDRFAEIEIVDHDGAKKPTSFLHKISTSKGIGYECDTYDVDENRAVATWMAGSNNHEIRAHEHIVRRVQEDLSIRADRVFDLEVNLEHVVREALSEIANRMIRTSQGMRVPDGDLIADAVNDVLDREVPDSLETTSKQDDKGNDDTTENIAQNDAQGAQNQPEKAVADGGVE